MNMAFSHISRPSLLLTGGSGFIGRNIRPLLAARYDVLAPGRGELDLSDERSTCDYLRRNRPDLLVHCAVLNPAKPADAAKSIYTDTIDIFRRLARHPFHRIVYIGSGAEFDKSHDITMAREDDLESAHPADEYGRAKRELTLKARASEGICNARIFGCYGPHEPERRFIRHAIACCFREEPITIRQDCRFSYVHVQDLGRAILRLLEGDPAHRDYNLCGGSPYLLSELAKIVKREMGATVPIRLLADGLAKDYTGDDSRFTAEFPNFKYTTIEDGIASEIAWLKGMSP